MEFITLAVTRKVMKNVGLQGDGGRQIAIQSASPELQARIGTANRNHRLVLVVGGEFELQIGDTGAIWPLHQEQPKQSDDFDFLFEFLSRRVGKRITFSAEERPHA